MATKRIVAWASTFLMLLTLARTCVLFLESRAEVRDEREADVELLQICSTGAARGSSKFTSACLQARADRASPLLLKAAVRAVATAWREFADVVSTPYGLLSALFFLTSSFLVPSLPWLRLLGRTVACEDDVESRVVVLTEGAGPRRRRRLNLPRDDWEIDDLTQEAPGAALGFHSVVSAN